MAGSFPITHDQMVQHLSDFRFITAETIEQHLSETSYVTGAAMRQFVMGELKTEHEALEKRLVDSVRELHDQTARTQGEFDTRVSAACTTFDQRSAELDTRLNGANETFDQRQAELTAGFENRDVQLRQHVDETARRNQESLNTLQAALSSHLEEKQKEVDQKMEHAMSILASESRRFYDEALQRAVGQQHFGGEGQGKGGGGGPRERALFDARDYKIADLPNEPSLAAFKKWRHDLELFLETIGVSWKGVTAVMRTSRLYNDTFSFGNRGAVESLRRQTEPSAPDLDASFNFYEKSDALYKLLMPKLSVSLSTELRQVGTPNGFELFRLLTQKLDPPRADSDFHLANELRSCAPPTPCKDFAQTVRFIKYFDQKQLDYTTETGNKFPDGDAARVFSSVKKLTR